MGKRNCEVWDSFHALLSALKSHNDTYMVFSLLVLQALFYILQLQLTEDSFNVILCSLSLNNFKSIYLNVSIFSNKDCV